MSAADAGGFRGLVGIHQALIRDPDTGITGTALRPDANTAPAHWTPSYALMPYQSVDVTALGLGGSSSFNDLDEARLDTAIRHVVAIEGPVHEQVLGYRLIDAAGVGRLGSRIHARIMARVDALEVAGEIEQRGSFIARAEQFLQPRLRDWRVLPDRLRQLDHVDGSELMLCLFHAVYEAGDIDVDTAMNNALHRIGFIRLTDNGRERLQDPLQALIAQGRVQRHGQQLQLGPSAFRR